MYMWLWLWWSLQAGGVGAVLSARVTYSVESALELSSLGTSGSVGYRLRGQLTVEPAWAEPESRALLRFTLQDVRLESRGAHALSEYVERPSAWESRALSHSVFYALRERGALSAAYLDSADPPDVLNYKRALLSLFQFQLTEGEFKESDMSGECDVQYETISPTVFRKIKRRCAFERDAGAGAGAWGELGARRVSRYTLSDARDSLAHLFAEELVWLRAGDAGAGGVQARSWHELVSARVEPASAAEREPAPPASAGLALSVPDDDADADAELGLEEALSAHGAALGGWQPGRGGSEEEALALMPLLRAVTRANASALTDLLHAQRDRDRLAGLCRAYGLAGTGAAWAAARSLLAPGGEDAQEELTHRFLDGFALAHEPQEEAAAEVLRLGEEAKLPAIAERALLAGAAAAGRGAAAARAAARGALAGSLARCRGAACRAVRLRALGNLRAGAAETLLAAAEAGGDAEAEAALGALRAARAEGGAPALRRLLALAGDASRSLSVRALALELGAARALRAEAGGAVPLALIELARRLRAERARGTHELRRALWERVDSLAHTEAARALRRHLPMDLRTWDARAHAGTTSVLRRDTGWEGAGWRAALDSAQLARDGVLVRGRVALLAASDRRGDAELLAVEVWTRGLSAMSGAGAEAEAEAEAPAAGLQLTVAGVALRPLPLFDGQAELLAQVWAGAGAAPQAVLRAQAGRGGARALAPLLAGAVLALRAEGAGALALDGHGDASLWHRTAHAGLTLRAAGGARAEARLLAPLWAEATVRVETSLAPRMRIRADLDFYDAVALCVRAQLEPHAQRSVSVLEARVGARRARVTRTRTALLARAGRTLALGARNDAACGLLRAQEGEDDVTAS